MISSNSRYLLTSVGIHAAAVGLLVFAPALSSRAVQDTPSPILEIIPDNLRLTDGNTIGGGNPNAQPPKGGPQLSAPPQPPVQEPPPPTPPPKTPPPEPSKAQEPPPEAPKAELLPPKTPPKKILATEIQRSLDFYLSTSSDSGIAGIYLSGGAARTPGLPRSIERQTGLPVEVVDPFRRIQVDERAFNPSFLQHVAPQAAVVVGLAMRRPGDK